MFVRLAGGELRSLQELDALKTYPGTATRLRHGHEL